MKITLLVFLFVSETWINGVFLAKGHEQGIIGGVVEALVFAVLNVVISFAIGLGGLRQFNCRSIFRKFLGLLSLVCWLVFVILLNLALAHYREVSGVLLEDAGAKVIARFRDAPLELVDIKSWLFFAIGMVWSALAMIDGIFYTDPFPGYAALELRVQKAHDNYQDRKRWLIGELQDIRDDATLKMEEAQSDLGKRRLEHTTILQGRASILQLFSEHQDQLERAGNALLSKYRAANGQTRSNKAPARFDERWTMDRPPIDAQLPEILLRKNLDQEIKKAEELLSREILAIHATFVDSAESYQQIDDLLPQEHHGAPVEKKLA